MSSSAWSACVQRQVERDLAQCRWRVADCATAGFSRSSGMLFFRLHRASVGVSAETIDHRRGRGVELVHRRQAQNQLDRADHAGLVIVGAVHHMPPRIGTDDHGHGAMAVDMVETVCGSSSPRKCRSRGQNLLWLTASTTRPSAKSLSATAASGVGKPGACRVCGRSESSMIIRFGNSPSVSKWFSSRMNCRPDTRRAQSPESRSSLRQIRLDL